MKEVIEDGVSYYDINGIKTIKTTFSQLKSWDECLVPIDDKNFALLQKYQDHYALIVKNYSHFTNEEIANLLWENNKKVLINEHPFIEQFEENNGKVLDFYQKNYNELVYKVIGDIEFDETIAEKNELISQLWALKSSMEKFFNNPLISEELKKQIKKEFSNLILP